MRSSTTHNAPLTPKDRLVIALDLDSDRDALVLVDELIGEVGMFKVGHQLFTAYGPDIVRRIRDKGGCVFLDLKFHDIPNTVAKASAEAVKLGVSIFNVHALGGVDMMKAAASAAKEEADRRLPRMTCSASFLVCALDQRSCSTTK